VRARDCRALQSHLLNNSPSSAVFIGVVLSSLRILQGVLCLMQGGAHDACSQCGWRAEPAWWWSNHVGVAAFTGAPEMRDASHARRPFAIWCGTDRGIEALRMSCMLCCAAVGWP
jgi:hypothetical protein